MRAIRYARGQDKKHALYRDLVSITQATLGYLNDSAARLDPCAGVTDVVQRVGWQAEVARLKPLIEQVIDQTQRRVFAGEKLAAARCADEAFHKKRGLSVEEMVKSQ